jgi:hypothetical protein
MPTFRSPVPSILSLCLAFLSQILSAQTSQGSLFFIDDQAASRGISRLSYPSLQLQTLDTGIVSDISFDQQRLFAARGNYADSSGIDAYDLSTLQKTDSLRGIRASRVEIWENYLLVACWDAPYIRVFDPEDQWKTVFVIDSNKVPSAPGAIQTDGSRAFLMESQSIMIIDLALQDTLKRLPTPHPYINQNQNSYLAQSETDLWLAVQYATGAVRSSLLRISKDSLKVRTAFHNEGNDFWGPPVPFGNQIHIYGYPTYYDTGMDSLMYAQSSYSYAIASDSNTLFVWDPGQNSLKSYTGGSLSSTFYYPGHIRDAQFLPQTSTQSLEKKGIFSLNCYPNPARGTVWLEREEPLTGWHYSWRDLRGRMIEAGNLPTAKEVALTVPPVIGLLVLELMSPEGEQTALRVLNQNR